MHQQQNQFRPRKPSGSDATLPGHDSLQNLQRIGNDGQGQSNPLKKPSGNAIASQDSQASRNASVQMSNPLTKPTGGDGSGCGGGGDHLNMLNKPSIFSLSLQNFSPSTPPSTSISTTNNNNHSSSASANGNAPPLTPPRTSSSQSKPSSASRDSSRDLTRGPSPSRRDLPPRGPHTHGSTGKASPTTAPTSGGSGNVSSRGIRSDPGGEQGRRVPVPRAWAKTLVVPMSTPQSNQGTLLRGKVRATSAQLPATDPPPDKCFEGISMLPSASMSLSSSAPRFNGRSDPPTSAAPSPDFPRPIRSEFFESSESESVGAPSPTAANFRGGRNSSPMTSGSSPPAQASPTSPALAPPTPMLASAVLGSRSLTGANRPNLVGLAVGDGITPLGEEVAPLPTVRQNRTGSSPPITARELPIPVLIGASSSPLPVQGSPPLVVAPPLSGSRAELKSPSHQEPLPSGSSPSAASTPGSSPRSSTAASTATTRPSPSRDEQARLRLPSPPPKQHAAPPPYLAPPGTDQNGLEVMPDMDASVEGEVDLELMSKLFSKANDTVELGVLKRATREIITTNRILGDARAAALADRDAMERVLSKYHQQQQHQQLHPPRQEISFC